MIFVRGIGVVGFVGGLVWFCVVGLMVFCLFVFLSMVCEKRFGTLYNPF